MLFLEDRLRRRCAAAAVVIIHRIDIAALLRLFISAAAIDLLDPTVPERLVDGDSFGGVRVEHFQHEDFDHRLVQMGKNRSARWRFVSYDHTVGMAGVEFLPARQELGIIGVRLVPIGRGPWLAFVDHADQYNCTCPDVQRSRIIIA